MVLLIVVFLITVGVILGAVVIVVALSAVHFFPEQAPSGEVSSRRAARIALGMTKDEVIGMLGNPQSRRDVKGRNEEWEYRILGAGSDQGDRLMKLTFQAEEGGIATLVAIDFLG